MSWLEDATRDARGRAVAGGFATVFQMMLAAIDTADPALLREHDGEWARVLPGWDLGPFDDLSDLAVAYNSTEITQDSDERKAVTPDVEHRTRDGLRVLRAVYRFGLLAWILKRPPSETGTRERRRMAGLLAAHFTDRALLTFVAGRAIELAGDRRLAWWGLMRRPRGDERVSVGSFAPALVAAYLSRLMDLLPVEPSAVELDLPAEAWLEQYESELREGIASASPIERDPSSAAGGRIPPDDQLGGARRRVTLAIDAVLAELKGAREARIREGRIEPVYRELFIVSACRSWSAHRVLGRTLGALGAPHADEGPATVELLHSVIPKAGFVGEGSNIHVESYGEQAGRVAAEAETAHILRLLSESHATPGLPGHGDQPLAQRTIEAIRQMTDEGYEPSVVFVPTDAGVWSRLAADTSNRQADQEQLRLKGAPPSLLRLVRARIAGVPVVSLPALGGGRVLIIDAKRALAVPQDFDPEGEDLQITMVERDPAETRQELLREELLPDEQRLSERLNERLQQLLVLGSAQLAYRVIDGAAVRIIE